MATATVFFTRLVQDSQDYGSDNEHMVSRVFFDLDIDGKRYPGLHANIKQVIGTSFEIGPLEVSAPIGYDGPFNQHEFQRSVERYYRGLIGAQGHGIRIAGGSSSILMRNNTFDSPQIDHFELPA